jgi:glycosyltransferase involved in cell wall biosynthesis
MSRPQETSRRSARAPLRSDLAEARTTAPARVRPANGSRVLPADATTSPLILIPAHNEEGRVGCVVDGILARVPDAQVLVIDDGSTDGTSEEATAHGAAVLQLPFNLGYGSALQTGYHYAHRHGVTRLAQLDADGQHDPASLPHLLAKLDDGYDVVVGSRYLGGDPPPTSLLRRVGSFVFARLVTWWTGVRVTDPTSGFQAFSARALDTLTHDSFPEDYPDADVLIVLSREGLRVTEVPVKMHPRLGGLSMHRGGRAAYYAYKMLLTLSLLVVRRRSPFRHPTIPARPPVADAHRRRRLVDPSRTPGANGRIEA